MRLPEPFKYLAGSVLIYYVMAACSAPTGGTSSAPGGTNPGATASSGGSGVGGSGSGSGGGVASSGGSSGGSSGSGGHSSSGSPVPDANADTSQSGSRLKAAYYVGTDGSKSFAEWQDSARGNEVCQFGTASDGSIRCLPSTSAVVEAYYADASCTQPLAIAEGTCATPPAYTYQYDTSGCGQYRLQLYPIAGAYTGTLYVGSPTSCSTTTASGTISYYRIGAQLSPSSFQLAQVQVD